MWKPEQLFKCLSDPTRLRCMALLLTHQKLCVCDLADALAISQPKVSRHLAQLRACQFVIDERDGQWVYYHINSDVPGWVPPIIDQLSTALVDDLVFNQAITYLKENKKTQA